MIPVNDREDFLKEVKKYLPHNVCCIEIGCYRGDFTNLLFEHIEPLILFALDSFTKSILQYPNGLTTAYSDKNDKKIFEQNIGELLNDRIILVQTFSYYAVTWMPNKYFGLIYHDASHLYEEIKRDLNDWLPKLTEGGLMCGHDYIEHEDFGVIQAVDEFCIEHNFEMIILNTNGGDFALRRKV